MVLKQITRLGRIKGGGERGMQRNYPVTSPLKVLESHPILSTNPMAATSGDSLISLGSNGRLSCWLPPFSTVFRSLISFPRFESVASNWLIENAEGTLAAGFEGTVVTTALSSILSSLSFLSSLCATGDVLSPGAHLTPAVQSSACDGCVCDCACSSRSSDLTLTGEFCWSRISESNLSVVSNFSWYSCAFSCDWVNCCLQSFSWCWRVKMVDCIPSTSSSSWITKSFNSKIEQP